MHNLLTVKETAKYLRIPLPTVYYLVQRGQLPAIQIGGRWRIKKSSLDKDILKEDKSGQPTVLVVDDDESLQNLFKLFLKKIGFSRVVVGTVKEALAALDKQKVRSHFSRSQVAGWAGRRCLRHREKRTTGMPDRHHYGLSRQRNAGSNSRQRPGDGFEEAAQSRAVEGDGAYSRAQRRRQIGGLITRPGRDRLGRRGWAARHLHSRCRRRPGASQLAKATRASHNCALIRLRG